MFFSIIEIFCVPSCYQISSILLLFSNKRECNRMESLSNLFSEINDWTIKVLFRRNFENRSQYFILQIESFFKKLHNYHWITGNRMDSRNGTLYPCQHTYVYFLLKFHWTWRHVVTKNRTTSWSPEALHAERLH